MLTQRAWLLGFVALCFYLIAVVNTLPGFYYLLTWLSLGLLAASAGIALLSLQGLVCELTLLKPTGHALWPGADDPASEALAPRLGVALSNTGTLNKTSLILEVRVVPAHLKNAKKREKRAATLRFLIEALPSGASQNATLPLGALGRGEWHIEGARVISSDALGLFRVPKKLAWPRESSRLVVAPVLLSLSGGRETKNPGGSRHGARPLMRLGVGDELRGARPYTSGDDFRHIHWPTTARSGALMVREYERAGRAAALVVWDGAAHTDWGLAPFSTLETALCAVISLVSALQNADTPVEIALLGEDARLWSDAEIGRRELDTALLEALSRARATRTTRLDAAVLGLLGGEMSRSDQVFLVSSSLNGDLLETARGFRMRGAQVSVLLLDAAAFEAAFQAAPATLGASLKRREIPSQADGEASHPLTRAAFDEREAQLRALDARVVRLVPAPANDLRVDTETALAQLLGGW